MKTIFLIFCFLPILVSAQINDGFSDGNFSENPSWTGNTDDFEINQQLQLQLKSSGSDTSVLFTRNNRIQETELNWWMKLSFNTSANNYARIYFVADTHEVNNISRALYLQVGGGMILFRFIARSTIPVKKFFPSPCTKQTTVLII